MKSKLAVALLIAVVGVASSWIIAAPKEKIKEGDIIPPMNLTSIHGNSLAIPSVGHKFVHLQFRRFAGCPICNLHLQTFVSRFSELQAAGILEVVVFHSSPEALLPFQGKFPFDVVGDLEKKIYGQFGVGSSIFSILDPRSWRPMSEAYGIKDKPTGDPEGGPFGLPADFLIAADGTVKAKKYGRHAYDQWSFDEVLALANQAQNVKQ